MQRFVILLFLVLLLFKEIAHSNTTFCRVYFWTEMTEIFRKGELLPSKNPPIFIETLLSPTKARYITDQRLSLFLCNIHELEAGSYYEMYKVYICTPFFYQKRSYYCLSHYPENSVNIHQLVEMDSSCVLEYWWFCVQLLILVVWWTVKLSAHFLLCDKFPLGIGHYSAAAKGVLFCCVARQYTFNTHRWWKPKRLSNKDKKYCDILYNSIVVSCFCLYIERSVGAVPCWLWLWFVS